MAVTDAADFDSGAEAFVDGGAYVVGSLFGFGFSNRNTMFAVNAI